MRGVRPISRVPCAPQAADLADLAVTATHPGVAVQLLLARNETDCDRAAVAQDAAQLRACLETAQVVATRAVSGALQMSWETLAAELGLPSATGPPGGWPLLVASLSAWFLASSPGYYSFVVMGPAVGHVRAFANGTEQAIRQTALTLGGSNPPITFRGSKYSAGTEFTVLEPLGAGEALAFELALLSPTTESSSPVFVFATLSAGLATQSKTLQSLAALGEVRIPESVLVAHAPPLCERSVLQLTAQQLMSMAQLEGSDAWTPWRRLADPVASLTQQAINAALACEAPGVGCRAMWSAGSWGEVLGLRNASGNWELPLHVGHLDPSRPESARLLALESLGAAAALQVRAFEQFFPWTATRILDATASTRITKLQLGKMEAHDSVPSVLSAVLVGSSPAGGLLSNLTLLTSIQAHAVPGLVGPLLADPLLGTGRPGCHIGPFAPGELVESVELVNAPQAQRLLLPMLPAVTSLRVVGSDSAEGAANLTGWIGTSTGSLLPRLRTVELEYVALPRGGDAFSWLCHGSGSTVESLVVKHARMDSTGPGLCQCNHLHTLRLFKSESHPDRDGLTSGISLHDCFPASFPSLAILDLSYQTFSNPVLPRPSPPQLPPFAQSLGQLSVAWSNVRDLGGIGAGLSNLTSLSLKGASLLVLPAAAAGLLETLTVGDLPFLQSLFAAPLPGEEPPAPGWSGSLVADSLGGGLTAELPNLRELELVDVPQLAMWPSHVFMPKLEVLTLSSAVAIESLPGLQQQVPKLKKLTAVAGRLKVLPWLGQLPDLEAVTAARNPGLASAEQPVDLRARARFSTWPSLSSVDLSEAGFRSVPLAFARAAPFELLDLQSNPLGSGHCSECLADVFGIRGFGLFSTPARRVVLDHAFKLPSLPVWVAEANESLSVLFANNVSLAYLPQELCQLQELRELRVDMNWLEELPVCIAHMVRPGRTL